MSKKTYDPKKIEEDFKGKYLKEFLRDPDSWKIEANSNPDNYDTDLKKAITVACGEYPLVTANSIVLNMGKYLPLWMQLCLEDDSDDVRNLFCAWDDTLNNFLDAESIFDFLANGGYKDYRTNSEILNELYSVMDDAALAVDGFIMELFFSWANHLIGNTDEKGIEEDKCSDNPLFFLIARDHGIDPDFFLWYLKKLRNEGGDYYLFPPILLSLKSLYEFSKIEAKSKEVPHDWWLSANGSTLKEEMESLETVKSYGDLMKQIDEYGTGRK